jgi:hypothetical protein
MPKAPRQLPSLPPPLRANPTARANSGLDRTWGQAQRLRLPRSSSGSGYRRAKNRLIFLSLSASSHPHDCVRSARQIHAAHEITRGHAPIGREPALSDHGDEPHSLFQEIACDFQGRAAGRGGDLAYSLRFARVTMHNKHSVGPCLF